MSSLGLSWLCNFLQHNLDVDDRYNASEKRLLTTLSTVCRHFRHIQIEDDSPGLCGRNYLTDDMDNFTFCGHRQGDDMTAHNCMNFVTEKLVALLVLENDVISHSASKTLYILSCHLMESVSEWKDFVDQLWICLKGICFDVDTQPIIDTSSQHSSYTIDQRPSSSGAIDTKVAYDISYLAKEVQCCDSSSNSNCLKKRYIGASRLIQLLRNILKTCFLKIEKLVDIYLQITEKYIIDVAWFLLNKFLLEDRLSPARSSYEPCPVSASSQGYCFKEKELALGSLLQFLCSLVHVVASKFCGGNIVIHCPLLKRVNDLLPALSVQALALHNHSGDTCISDFLRHKSLDDLMFEMLLQLLDMYLFMQQEQHKGNNVLDDKQCMDTCLPIIETLKPDSLLHEFLAAIEYDDSVIVDYLISKNTGTLCLRYLLRSLRILSDLGPASAGSITDIGDPSHLNCKREQHQLDLKEPLERKLSVVSDTSKITKARNDGCELEENVHNSKRDGGFLSLSMIDVDSSSFQRAKGCLSSLHFRIESLHRKDLFPYNPSPLLKRLEKFLLLCNESQRV